MAQAARATAASLLLASVATLAASLFTTLPQSAANHGPRASVASVGAPAPADLTWG